MVQSCRRRWSSVITLLVFAAFFLCTSAKQGHGSTTSAEDDDVIEVFIIPHTHDDVGWLLSVDQYYVRQVQWILDSCIQQLLDNPERKFTYVEMAYFQRWWDRLPESRREQVRMLYKRGQLEFNLGGISMNDEGVTTYYEEINQMSHGAAFLEKELGAHSRSAWHIDPFGHSAATASLWSDVGFDGFVLNRIPQDTKAVWKAQQKLEFIWRPSKRNGNANDIWIHVLDTWYSSPSECAFNNDDGWNGVYIQDDPRIFDENVDQIVNNFVEMAKGRSQFYRHNKLLIPFGDDFAHREAFTSFVQMDKLIKYVNQNTSKSRVKARYAFLSDYVAAVNSLNLTWPVYEGDFFPYADGTSNGSYWSGYFTSRIALKGYVRSSDSLLHAGELLFTLFKDSVLKSEEAKVKANSQLEVLRQAAYVATHHDAVTGTEKTAVAVDYTMRLDMGNKAVDNFITTVMQSLDTNSAAEPAAAAARTAVKLFNPLGWTRKEVLRIPINSANVKVIDSAGRTVLSQVNPVPAYSLDRESAAYNLFFVVELRPLEILTFYIQASQFAGEEGQAHLGTMGTFEVVTSIENEYLRVYLDPQTNRIGAITSKKTGVSAKMEQNFLQYLPASGEEIQASGAYIFQPTSNTEFNSGNSQNNLHVVTRHFPREYATVPHVLALPRGQDYNDTFAVSVRSVTTKQVTFNIYRLDNTGDNQGWSQSLQLDYLAFEGPQGLPVNGSQYGILDVGAWHTPVATAIIKFTAPFSDVPRVFATVTGEDYDDTFAVSVQLVTSSYAVVNINRVNGGGWNQDVKVTWWAFPSSASSSTPAAAAAALPPAYPAFISGRTVAPASPASPHLAVNIRHPEFWLNPLILLTVRGQSNGNGNNTWATTVRPIADQTSFLVNLYLTTGSGWRDNVEIDWVLVRRDTIVESVLPPSRPLVNTTAYVGPVVQEIQQSFKPGYAQTVRLYQGTNDEFAGNFIEITEETGPIDHGTEFVTRFTTDLNNQFTFYTDDNSLLVQKRVFNASKHDPVPANYYPMVARAFIQDTTKNLQFTLVSDRSHGAASLNAGELEVMLDRRCVSDDGRGVGETLDEKNRTQQALWALFDGIDNSALLHRKLALRQQFPIQTTTYATTTATTVPVDRQLPGRVSGLGAELPFNVHLLALYTQDYLNFTQFSAHPSAFAAAARGIDDAKTSRVLVRLQHIFEEGESVKYATPVEVRLDALLTLAGWKLTNVTEMNLTANRAKADVQKLKWLTRGSLTTVEGPEQQVASEATVVTLYPSEIRTFLFEFTAV